MKTLTVHEAQGQLGQLVTEASLGSVITLTNGAQRATLTAGELLDPQADSAELEAALLKSVDGPYTPYSAEEMRAIVERIIREEKRG